MDNVVFMEILQPFQQLNHDAFHLKKEESNLTK